MKFKLLLLLCCVLAVFTVRAQYVLPACEPAWVPGSTSTVGQKVSYQGTNYESKWANTETPGGEGWTLLGRCGNALGPNWTGSQRIIGYMPTWGNFNVRTEFDAAAVTHINVAFILFQQNNNDYNSANFASIAWAPFHKRKVDSLLVDAGLLSQARAKGTTVSVAVGGATDFAFLWLLTKYYNNDAMLDQMATLITNYVNAAGLDGVDLDLECWWPDAAITGTTEQGGRVRGTSWGGSKDDVGPHPAGLGLTKLAQKLRQKMPSKLISAAVFGTSYYANNYDDAMHQYMDWIGLMTYDFTGSWNDSPIGPHSSLHKIPAGTYERQSDANPIYSVEDALEYWMGMAKPAWNHDGGFSVPKAKLVTGVPLYGYDLATRKPNNANGFLFVPYKDILAQYSNAATSFDPKDTRQLGGYIGLDNKKIYYETPKGAAAKINYNKAYGHQGVIVWELTQDAPFSNANSILKAVNTAAGRGTSTCNPTAIVPQISVNGGAWQQTSSATVAVGGSVVVGPQPATGGTWSWTGPNSFSRTTREVSLTNIQTNQAGSYVATYTNSCGTKSTHTITITVTGGTCPATAITPYLTVNGGAWQQTSTATLNAGGTVTVGPHPTSGGSWAWTGPAGFTATTREITRSNIQTTQGGNYIATYTNTCGTKSTHTITITVNSTCTPTAINPYLSVNGGAWQNVSTASLAAGGRISVGPQPATGGSWAWTGPNSFTSTAREFTISNIQTNQGGNYIATYTNSTGCKSTRTFTITVTGGTATCTVSAWSSTATYVKPNRVSRNGNVYEAKWWTQNNDPATNSCTDCVWQLIGACTSRLAASELSSSADVSVYPNPTILGGKLNVDMDNLYDNVQISITSISGGKEYNYSYKDVKGIEMDLPNLPKGVMVVKISAGNKTWIKKVINN